MSPMIVAIGMYRAADVVTCAAFAAFLRRREQRRRRASNAIYGRHLMNRIGVLMRARRYGVSDESMNTGLSTAYGRRA